MLFVIENIELKICCAERKYGQKMIQTAPDSLPSLFKCLSSSAFFIWWQL